MKKVRTPYILSALCTVVFFLFIHALPDSVSAFTSGGTATMTVSPASGTLSIGQDYTVDVLFNTKNIPVSSMQFRLLVPVVGSDIEVVRTEYNTGISGCSSVLATSKMVSDVIQVDVASVCVSVTGFSTNKNTKIASIIVKAKNGFSSKTIQFEQSESYIYKKDGAVDILGSTTNGSFATSGIGGPQILTPTQGGESSNPPTTCDSSCDLVKGCGGNVTCVSTTGVYRCRNASCPSVANCTCPNAPTPTKKSGYSYIIATRTPAPTSTTAPIAMISEAILSPTPTLTSKEPTLTVDSFYDASRNAKSTFFVSGISDPNAEISLEITPDIIIKTTTANSSGSWSIQISPALKNGEKSMTVTATNVDGGKTFKTIMFSIKSGSSLLTNAMIVVALAVIGAIGYMIYTKKLKKTPQIPPVRPQPTDSSTVPPMTPAQPSEQPQQPPQ
jgi:hypothetical protein